MRGWILLIVIVAFCFKQLFEKWVVIKIRSKKRKKWKNKDKGDAREKKIEMWEEIDSYKNKENCERK